MDKRLIDTTSELVRPPEPAAATSLREFLALLMRRKLIIIATAGIGLLLSILFVTTAEPQYTASLELAFEPNAGPVNDVQSLPLAPPIDEAFILTEIEAMRSRGLAAKVIDQLRLQNDDELNPTRSWIGILLDRLREPDQQSAEVQRQLAIDEFLRNLSVEHLAKSRRRAVLHLQGPR
jgi:polysaccharide biosynthesis transport protein